VVQYVVEEMRAARMDHICLVTGRKKTLIQEHFDHDPELVRHLQDRGSDELLAELAYLESGLNLTYIRQSGPQGLADAVGLVEDFARSKPFVVALGDSMICEQRPGNLVRRMIQEHLAHDAVATVAVEAVPIEHTHLHTIVRPAASVPKEETPFMIADLVQRPAGDQTPGKWALASRFVFSPGVFSAIRKTRPDSGNETQLTDTIRILAREGHRVQAVPLSPSQRRLDIGTFRGYYRAFLEFALRDPDFAEEVRTYLEQATTPR
jgi:UTP--glucose-1-phosphate uridylyltransferase